MLPTILAFLCGGVAFYLYQLNWWIYAIYTSVIFCVVVTFISYRLTELLMHADLEKMTCSSEYLVKTSRCLCTSMYFIVTSSVPALLFGCSGLPDGMIGAFVR